MGVKKVLDELLVQYLFYAHSVHISILSFQHENCKRMHPSGFQIITWQAVVLSLCLRGCWEDEGGCPGHTLADNLSDRLHETGAGEVFTVCPCCRHLCPCRPKDGEDCPADSAALDIDTDGRVGAGCHAVYADVADTAHDTTRTTPKKGDGRWCCRETTGTCPQ